MAEEWRPVVGHEGYYEVSSHGRVRSIERTIVTKQGVRRRLPGQMMAQTADAHGYLRVTLSGPRLRVPLVHALVAEAFHGARQPGLEVCHNDGDKLNNKATNLRWGTRSENAQDSVRHGSHALASRTHCSQSHEYTVENTRWYRGFRVCRQCEQLRALRRRPKARAA